MWCSQVHCSFWCTSRIKINKKILESMKRLWWEQSSAAHQHRPCNIAEKAWANSISEQIGDPPTVPEWNQKEYANAIYEVYRSEGTEVSQKGPVTAGHSKLSKRLKRRTSDKYHKHTIIQRRSSRGHISALKQKTCQTAQAIDWDVLEDSSKYQPLIGTKHGAPTFAVNLVAMKTT